MKIGDKKHIAFEIIDKNPTGDLWHINFYLGGKLISNEAVYIPTYILELERLSNQLLERKFENLKFDGISHANCFNTLIKERDHKEDQFFNHLLQIDETIDQYIIFLFQNTLETAFVWSCWNKFNCNSEHSVNEIYYVQFLTEELVSMINQLINRIKQFANTV
jgi:hypothetical protein